MICSTSHALSPFTVFSHYSSLPHFLAFPCIYTRLLVSPPQGTLWRQYHHSCRTIDGHCFFHLYKCSKYARISPTTTPSTISNPIRCLLSVLRKCGKSSVIHTIIFIHCDHGCCNYGDYDVICLSMFVVQFIEGKGDICTSKQSLDTVVSEPRVGKGDHTHIHLSVFMSKRVVVFSLFARYFLAPQSHRTVQRTCFRVGIRIKKIDGYIALDIRV